MILDYEESLELGQLLFLCWSAVKEGPLVGSLSKRVPLFESLSKSDSLFGSLSKSAPLFWITDKECSPVWMTDYAHPLFDLLTERWSLDSRKQCLGL